jgi:DNA helicase IV
VILRTPDAAKRFARLVSRAVSVHLVVDGDFHFGAGINVACVEDVKGLEFDYIVVPDASAAVYPETSPARRALYVAVTRTVHQLVLASVGTPSPLLLAAPVA